MGDSSFAIRHPVLAAYPVVVELDVAWGEMDSYGHVNNVVYFRYFENARIAYFDRIGWSSLKLEQGLGPILASTSARYRKPITYPDHLFIGARVIDLQSDRISLEHKILSTRWNDVACEGQAVAVSYDYNQQTKIVIPDSIRQAIRHLEGWELNATSPTSTYQLG